MRRLLLIWNLLLAGIVCIAQSERVGAFWQSRDSNYNQKVVSGGGGGCAAATTFLARTSGLSGTETTAYTTMICGMITDGTGCSAWSGSSGNLDALYIFATNTTTTAALNLCSTSFGITANGTMTFTADHGWAGDGSTGYLDTGYEPFTAGGNYTQNSASIGFYDQTASTPAFVIHMGASNAGGTDQTYLAPYGTGVSRFIINSSAANEVGGSPTSNQGQWIATRTGASVEVLYLNGNTTPTLSGTDSSTGLSAFTMFIGADNIAGTALYFTTDQFSAVIIGGALTSANMALVASRINAYMTALGVNVY